MGQKAKRSRRITLAVAFAFICSMGILSSGIFREQVSASAETVSSEISYEQVSDSAEAVSDESSQFTEEDVEPRGLWTNISLGMVGADGVVTAKVSNKLTIGFSKIIVYVELYCSDTYQESHTTMTLIASNYTSDLNIGETITASASTNGESKYWNARVRYKFDSNPWVTESTGTVLYDGNANLIE